MKSFDDKEHSSNSIPEKRAEVDIEIERAEFLRSYLKQSPEDTAAFITIAETFRKLVGREAVDLAGIFRKLDTLSPWLIRLYCAYILDNNKNSYQTAKDFGIHDMDVIRCYKKVNQTFESSA